MRLRNRNAPSTPCSFQSRSFSGGAAKRMKSLAVSAPYRSINVEGSTTFRFDLDIFIDPPTPTVSPHWRHFPFSSTSSGYLQPCLGHSAVCMQTIPWERRRSNGSFPRGRPLSPGYFGGKRGGEGGVPGWAHPPP